MAGLSDLQNLLDDDSTSLDCRLKLALSKFTAVDSNVTKNRELVLTWLKSRLLDRNTSIEHWKLMCSVLKHCIFMVTDILLCPQLAKSIFEIILQSSHTQPEILECFDEVLNSIHFLKYFIYHVQELTDILISLANALSSNHMDAGRKVNCYKTISNSILYVTNNSSQTNDLKSVFVESLIETFSTLSTEAKASRLFESDELPFENIFHRVLFSDADFRRSFSHNIFVSAAVDNSNPEKLTIDAILTIRSFPTHFKPDVLASAYSLILSGFLLSNADMNAKLRVFVGLSSFVYVRPVNMDDHNPKCVMFNENIITVNSLIELLLKFDLPLDSETQSVTLADWLKALIDFILDEIKSNRTPAVLQLLKNALSFSPVFMETCLKKFSKNVMLTKKVEPEVIKSYSDLCLYVLNIHIKINRMQKLISALLMTVKESLTEFAVEDVPTKFDVLPTDVFDKIQSAVTHLPSTVQNMALLNTLLFHLEKDCIAVLEQEHSKQADVRLQLMLDIVTYLITRFVTGTRIMDHSVPNVVKDKFIALMENLGALLGRFGKAVISKEHMPGFVECFLQMCLVWGDMQMVFMVYEAAPRKVLKQTGVAGRLPTNLVYLHPYLTDFHWNLIAQRVANFGSENCVNLLNDLVLQKIHALRYLEDEIQGPYEENVNGDGPAVVCAHYLSGQSNAKWIFHRVPEFVHLLKPIDVLQLAKALMSYCQTCEDEEISQIFSADFREMRSLVLAMTSYVFHSLSKKLAKCNLKELKRILRRLDYEAMIDAEEGDAAAVNSVKSKLGDISVMVSHDFQFIESNVDVESIEKDIRILLHLPARYLHDENKTVICLLTLSLIKNFIKLRFNEGNVLVDLLKFLQGVLTNLELPESLDCGKILAWFYRGLKNTPNCDETMRRLCQASRRFGSGVDSVIEIVEAANSGQQLVDIFVDSKSESVDLLTTYLVNFEKARKRKNTDAEGSEVKEKLQKLCYKNFDEVFRSISSDCLHREKQLALYTLLLHEALKSRDEEHLQLLLVHLAEFNEFVEKNADSSSEAVCRFLLVMLKYAKELKPFLPYDFVTTAWCCQWPVADDIVIAAFLKTADVHAYKEMIQIVLVNMEGCLHAPDEDQLSLLHRRWKTILDTSVKEVKMKVKKKMMSELCAMAQRTQMGIAREGSSASVAVRTTFVKIFTLFLQNKQIPLRYQVIDLCFDLASFPVHTVGSDSELIDCIEMMFVFCLARASLLLDRIPSFYLCYKSLYTRLLRRARVPENLNIDTVSTAAHKLEKLTDLLVKYKKDFAKTAVSAVADLVSAVAEVKIDDRVQKHLMNVIYCWIGMCDLHGLQYLSSALPPVSQNLFKQFWSDYNKYHKFSGKV